MSESRLKKVKRNMISSFGFKLCTIVLQFIARVIFVRVLNESFLGINGLFSNIIGVLSLADLGLSTAIMYSLYKPIAEKNNKKIGQLIKFFRKIYFIIASIVGIMGVILIPFLRYIVNLDTPIEHLEIYYLLFLTNTVISYLFVYRTILLEADQKNYIVNRYNVIFQIITFLSQIIILVLFKNYILYILVGVICSFINNLVLNHVTLKIYPFLKGTEGDLDVNEKKIIFENVKSLFLYKISSVIQGNTDNILISLFVGTIIVGQYSNYYMVIASVTTFIGLMFSAIKASLGNLIAENISDEKKFNIFNIIEFFNFWIIGFCSISFIVLFQDFIILFFGEQYLIPFSSIIVVIANFYTSNIRQSIWAYRETTGIFKETKYITMCTSIINLNLSLILGYKFGLIGILSATVIARMIYAFWKEPLILYKKVFKRAPKTYFVRYVSNVIILIFTAVVTMAIANISITTNIRMNFVYKIIICVVVPNIMFGVIFCKSDQFKYILNKYIRPRAKLIFGHS